jgi:hypothetical protein
VVSPGARKFPKIFGNQIVPSADQSGVKTTRFIGLALIAWIGFGGIAGVASAHAEFGQGAVPMGIESAVTLTVPHEYGGGFFNIRVRVQIPAGWQAVGCNGGSVWSCTTGPVVTFANNAGAASGQDEEFTIRLLGPTTVTGPAYFPIVQTYNATLPGNGHGDATGAEVLWTQSAFLSTFAPAQSPPTTATGSSQSAASPSLQPSPDSSGSAPVSAQPPAAGDPVPTDDTAAPGGALGVGDAGTSITSEGTATLSSRTESVDESTRSGAPLLVAVFVVIAIVIVIALGVRRSRLHR